MGKLFFWIVVIALIWLAVSFVRTSQRRQERAAGTSPDAGPRAAGPAGRQRRQPAEQMVACERCGVFLPASQALRGRKGQYCCAEHRDAEGR